MFNAPQYPTRPTKQRDYSNRRRAANLKAIINFLNQPGAAAAPAFTTEHPSKAKSITLRLFMDRYTCYLLIGSPGAGKGTQGKVLGTIPGFFHCACGDVFRALDLRTPLG